MHICLWTNFDFSPQIVLRSTFSLDARIGTKASSVDLTTKLGILGASGKCISWLIALGWLHMRQSPAGKECGQPITRCFLDTGTYDWRYMLIAFQLVAIHLTIVDQLRRLIEDEVESIEVPPPVC